MTIRTAPKHRKAQSTTQLRKTAWRAFSELTRRKAKGVCYTCGKVNDWKSCNAGHFVHRDCLDFDERNIKNQCVGCNMFRHGNSIAFAVHLEADYGHGILQELKSLADKGHNWKVDELKELIARYKKELAKLQTTHVSY